METSKNSTRQLTLDELIYLQEDSHVNRTAPQENEKERKTNATCGRRCLELFESVRPVGSWERTFAGLLIGTEGWFSKRCALTWKLVGTPYNRLFFQLLPSTLPTEETGCGLLPTPVAQMGNRLLDENGENRATNGMRYGVTLNQLAKSGLLPTPTTSDYKGGRKKETLEASGRGATNSLPDAFSQHGKTSQLNPLFVEEMMGFPKGWTVSPFQSGEENQSKPTETR